MFGIEFKNEILSAKFNKIITMKIEIMDKKTN